MPNDWEDVGIHAALSFGAFFVFCLVIGWWAAIPVLLFWYIREGWQQHTRHEPSIARAMCPWTWSTQKVWEGIVSPLAGIGLALPACYWMIDMPH